MKKPKGALEHLQVSRKLAKAQETKILAVLRAVRQYVTPEQFKEIIQTAKDIINSEKGGTDNGKN